MVLPSPKAHANYAALVQYVNQPNLSNGLENSEEIQAMIFLPKTLWDDLPIEVSNHIAQNYKAPVAHEKDIYVIGEYRAYKLEGSGNWFAGNLHASRAK